MTNESIAVKIAKHDEEIGSLKHRMNDCEEQNKSLNELTTAIKTLAVNMKFMADEQKKQGQRLERLENEPADDYKHYKRVIIDCIATGIISAILGAVLASILM